MNDKFEYPIFPDRVYTLETDLVRYKVKGSLLIKAYLHYVLSTEYQSYPQVYPQINITDNENLSQ